MHIASPEIVIELCWADLKGVIFVNADMTSVAAHDLYMQNNDYRYALGQVLDLTDEQEQHLQEAIERDIEKKPKWGPLVNCATKARDMLDKATDGAFDG